MHFHYLDAMLRGDLTCVWHVAIQATIMQHACFEPPTRSVICTESAPCLGVFSLLSVSPRFSRTHGQTLLCIDDDDDGTYIFTSRREVLEDMYSRLVVSPEKTGRVLVLQSHRKPG